MNLSVVGNVVLIVLLIGWFGYRQTTWRPVATGRMWVTPLIMAVVGLGTGVQHGATLTGIELAVLVVELVVSLGVGAWMGAIAHFRRISRDAAPSGRDAGAVYESRTGWWGLALWLVVIGLRVGIDVVGAQLGAHVATATGLILVLFAANRLARSAVLAVRLQRYEAAVPAAAGIPRP